MSGGSEEGGGLKRRGEGRRGARSRPLLFLGTRLGRGGGGF